MQYDFEPKQANTKVNIIFYILLSLVLTIVTSLLAKYVLGLMAEGNGITNYNRSDYLTIFVAHCSIVFLTTSLMAMLSENDRYVYWVDMITSVLIQPRFLSFLPLVVYSLSTIAWAMVGFILSFGWIVIGSFVFGMTAVTVLFSRMVAIYYQQENNKLKIENFLMKKISENKYEKYLLRLKEITFIKSDKREFYDVYDNLNLLEKSIKKLWEQSGRTNQFIFHAEGDAECIYVNLIIDLSIKYPQEMQQYIESHSDSNETIRKLCYLAYPTILNSFLSNSRKDLFYRVLNKWSLVANQRDELIEYISNKAIEGNSQVVSEYYSKLFNPFIREIELPDDDMFYIYILSIVYWKNTQAFEEICSSNRFSIYQHYYNKKSQEDLSFENVLAICSEISISNTGQDDGFIKFLSSMLNHEIIDHMDGDAEERVKIEHNPKLYRVIKAIIQNRKEEDILYLCEKIIELVNNPDSGIYINSGHDISFYVDFEQWALDYALIKNKKEMGNKDNMNESKKIIDILQSMLEKMNYKNRRKRQIKW